MYKSEHCFFGCMDHISSYWNI